MPEEALTTEEAGVDSELRDLGYKLEKHRRGYWVVSLPDEFGEGQLAYGAPTPKTLGPIQRWIAQMRELEEEE
jgi:hypothetical protein